MQVIFLKANRPTAKLIEKVIAFWTAPFKDKLNGKWKEGFSHCELFDGTNKYSSTFSGNVKGVRANIHVHNEYSWVYVDVPEINADKAIEFFNTQLGKKYDYLGLYGFVIPFKDHESKWFCSEIVTEALKISGCKKVWGVCSDKVSPNRLYKLLSE